MKITTQQTLALNALGILLLCHWGTNNESNDSLVGGGKKPDVNFYGSIIDNTGTTVQAQNITISGMYKQIPVYLKPQNLTQKDYNPADNIAFLDLAEIGTIASQNSEHIYTFLNRPYIEITIVSKDGITTNMYLIETNKKIHFDEVNQSGPIEREIAFTALHEINLTGYQQAIKEAEQPTKSIRVASQKK